MRPVGTYLAFPRPVGITRTRMGTLRLQERSQSEGDGLTADLTHPLSLGDANTAWVAVLPGYPNPVQPVGRGGRHRERIAPSTGYLRIGGLR